MNASGSSCATLAATPNSNAKMMKTFTSRLLSLMKVRKAVVAYPRRPKPFLRDLLRAAERVLLGVDVVQRRLRQFGLGQG